MTPRDVLFGLADAVATLAVALSIWFGGFTLAAVMWGALP